MESSRDSEGMAPLLAGMSMKVGVMGSASGDILRDYLEKAFELGRAVARRGCVLVTGACPGLPLAAAGGAKHESGFVVGISPGLSLDEHLFKYRSPAEWHDVLIFTGSGLMEREVVNIRSSDIVVIVGGGSGTLGELAIAYDEGKLIGVLTGTGGISDMVADIIAACAKQTGARVIYESDPPRLVDRLVATYKKVHYRQPSCFSAEKATEDQRARIFRTVRDMVCGMWIDPATAPADRTCDGHTHYFCSETCANEFDADPKRFLMKAPTPH